MVLTSHCAARPLCLSMVISGVVAANEPGYLVSWHLTHSIRSYDADGQYLGDFAVGDGLSSPQHMDISTDGILYVGTWITDSVRMYDARTGDFLGVLAQGGPLNGATWLEVEDGSGDLLVTSNLNNRILRYDRHTGELLGDVVPPNFLVAPHEILRLGDGTMIVGSFTQNRIARFDERTGAYLNDFAAGAPLAGPGGLELSPDGEIVYVNNWNSGDVLMYDIDGTFIDTLFTDPDISNLDSIAIDLDGNLVIASWGANLVLQIDPMTGDVLNEFETISPLNGPNEAMVLPGCRADFNCDGQSNVLDFVDFQLAFVAADPKADCDGDDGLDVLDFVCFQTVFAEGCG